MLGVWLAKLLRIAGGTCGAGLVAGLLQLGKHAEVDVEHVLLRPHGAAVFQIVLVIVVTVGRKLQGYHVLVVVVAVVAAQTDEDSQLVVAQRIVVDEVVGVDKHLQVLVLPHIEGGIAVDGLRLAMRQVVHHQAQRLLVVLGELWLRGVGDTGNARRQHIVDGAAVVVFLDVDGTDFHGAAVTRSRQLLIVVTPLAAHQVERAETQHDGFAELGEEHTHEADAGEVADATLAILVGAQWDAELVPLDGFLVAIAQRRSVFADVGDVVMS